MLTNKEFKRKKLFIRFLKENNCYYGFFNNMLNSRLTYVDLSKYKGFDHLIKLDINLISSFDWEYTNEGYDFWDKLYDKWADIMIWIDVKQGLDY